MGGVGGPLESDNSFASRDIAATTNFGRIKRNLSVRHGSIPKSLSHAKDQVIQQKRWGLMIEEFHKWWISEPNPVLVSAGAIPLFPHGFSSRGNTAYIERNIALPMTSLSRWLTGRSGRRDPISRMT